MYGQVDGQLNGWTRRLMVRLKDGGSDRRIDKILYEKALPQEEN